MTPTHTEPLYDSFLRTYTDALAEVMGTGQTFVITYDRDRQDFSAWRYDGSPPAYYWLFIDGRWKETVGITIPEGPISESFRNRATSALARSGVLRPWFEQALRDPIPAAELVPAFAEAYAAAVLLYTNPKRERPSDEEEDFIGIVYDFPSASFLCREGRQSALVAVRVDSGWQDLVGELDVPTMPGSAGYSADQIRKAIAAKIAAHPRVERLVDAVRAGME